MGDGAAITDVNKRAYQAAGHVRNYARAADNGLFPAERMAFGLLGPEERRSVLDIGIGGGRTVPILSGMFQRYIGIDYSAPLVDAARQRFPHMRLEVMDARTMRFAEKFDCIVFSYNGIDYVPKSDRSRILANIAAHLRDGGTFIYSTHNLSYRRVPHWLRSFWVRELIVPPRQWKCVLRRAANFGKQTRGDGIAYVNDPGLGFSLLTAYVDIEAEAEELKGYGLDITCRIGCEKQHLSYDERDGWVYLMAKKGGTRSPGAREARWVDASPVD